jgi:hypothetical protein
VVAAVQLPGVTAASSISSLGELERLATTLGLRPVGGWSQRRGKLAPGKVFGDGKLHELAALDRRRRRARATCGRAAGRPGRARTTDELDETETETARPPTPTTTPTTTATTPTPTVKAMATDTDGDTDGDGDGDDEACRGAAPERRRSCSSITS